jgi:hypothetical protein
MEKQTKLYLVLAALGVAGYFLWKKSKKQAASVPQGASKAPEVSYSYPVGLKEGDAVKGTTEDVFMLKAGKKHPVTYEWWVYNVNDFSKVKLVEDSVLNLIPTGETFK